MSQALLIGGSLSLLLALLAGVRHAARRVAIPAEGQRKLIHLGLGLYCLAFPWIFPAPWQVAVLCALTLAVLTALRFARREPPRPSEAWEREGPVLRSEAEGDGRVRAAPHGAEPAPQAAPDQRYALALTLPSPSGRRAPPSPTLRAGEGIYDLGQALFSVGRRSYGDLLFALAIAIVFFRSGSDPVLYVLPVAILTLSDAAAALVGSSYGRRRFTVEAGQKSWEGVALFFLTAWIIAMAALLLLSDVPRPNVILLGLFVAAFGAFIEADSWRGLDNLFVPVALQAILIDAIPASEGRLLELLLMLAGTMVVAIAAARILQASQHVARAAGLVLFMIWTIAGLEDVILPAAAFAAAVVAQRLRPVPVQFPHLATLSAIVAVGLLWLVVGESAGFVAIDYFNLSFAAAAAALIAMAVPQRRGIAGAAALAALAMQQAQAWLLRPEDPRSIAFVSICAAALLLAAVIALATAGWRDRLRVPKAFGLGLGAGLAAMAVLA